VPPRALFFTWHHTIIEEIMKSTKLLLSSLAASAVLLTLSACKENSTSAESETSSNPVASNSEYPLDVCVVSGEKLGSMGEPFVIDYEGTEVRFCCDNCLPKFNEDPAKYVAMVKTGTPPSHEGNH
jgi:YHS domain-containing protein